MRVPIFFDAKHASSPKESTSAYHNGTLLLLYDASSSGVQLPTRPIEPLCTHDDRSLRIDATGTHLDRRNRPQLVQNTPNSRAESQSRLTNAQPADPGCCAEFDAHRDRLHDVLVNSMFATLARDGNAKQGTLAV